MMNKSQHLCLNKYLDTDALIAEALRRLEVRLQDGNFLTNPHDTRNYLCFQLAHELNEVFAVVFLNNANSVITFEKMFFGTINSARVYPRVVAQRALALNAAAVIFAHNHPSGFAEPSTADKYLTQQLKTALELLDIRVLDHMIIGDGACVSFAERGYL
jgi:DNA repair protein RadC